MPDIKIRSARYDEPAVIALLVHVMAELSGRYGGSGDDTPVDPADFVPPNGAFFVASEGPGGLIACAGWRRHGDDAELKRMFTASEARGRGLGRRMLATIEESAREAGCKRVILETGDRQPEAVGLYESAGYTRIDDFGYYAGQEGVLSFAKVL
ncbi:GNAT family N-acetyltransferase [Actinoplanes sp. NPDC051411]|uniref:GNAT family N-acetyltransferase n=1 Tax=Actinoplanes sp. NPDC051411 TaxID=3155522 RepID=UPI0034140BE3